MKHPLHYLLLGLFLTLPIALYAGSIETYTFKTPEQEAIYQGLIKELRCLVCQNQDIAGSNAELAQDLRRQTYEMVSAGKSRDDVVAYMVERYGDFVLYRPPFKMKTLLLWVGPPLFLLLSLLFLVKFLRNRPAKAEIELDNTQRESMRDLLK
jgi:cytochrome c-type biogenesis protein CcmH